MRNPTRVLMSMLVTLLASACTSAQPITEPVAVIEAFYEAVNDGDLDTAMGFVADDASFIIKGGPTTTTYTGTEEVQGYFQRLINRNSQHELSDLILEGDTVTWVLYVTSTLGESSGTEDAVVQAGKIASFQSRVIKDS